MCAPEFYYLSVNWVVSGKLSNFAGGKGFWYGKR